MVYMSGSAAKRTAAHRRIRVVVGAVLVSCLIWAFTAIPYDILREERARLYGEEATVGVIVSADPESSPDHPGAGLVVSYRYVDPDGFPRTAEARMPDSVRSKYLPGKPVKVIYVRGRPDMVRLPGQEEPAFQLWLRDFMN